MTWPTCSARARRALRPFRRLSLSTVVENFAAMVQSETPRLTLYGTPLTPPDTPPPPPPPPPPPRRPPQGGPPRPPAFPPQRPPRQHVRSARHGDHQHASHLDLLVSLDAVGAQNRRLSHAVRARDLGQRLA